MRFYQPMLRVLVGDDQPDVLEAARLVLKTGGHVAVTAGTPEAVLRTACEGPFDVLLLDMNYARDTTSGAEGLDLLCGLRACGVNAPVVVMTAWGSVDLAVEAMRRGASDFVQKPWDNARLLESVDRYGKQARSNRSDLEIARSVQQNLLGCTRKTFDNLDCAAGCLPAREIGGDYYDFFDLGEGRLGVVVADVSGKGISAALLMAHLQAAMRSRSDLASSPADMMSVVNRVFWESSPPEQFATVFYGVIDSRAQTLRYANAGHVSAILGSADGTAVELASNGMPIGLFSSWRGEETPVKLNRGDRIAIVSDGVMEAGVENDSELGLAGLTETLHRAGPMTAEMLVSRIISAAQHSTDDRTAVVVNVS